MTVDTIRFYEKLGLLPTARRSTGHFRVYGPLDLERVRFIQQMQALGFSLREIGELVDLRGRKTEACEVVRKLLHEKLATTRAKAHFGKSSRIGGPPHAGSGMIHSEKTPATSCRKSVWTRF